MVETKKLSDWFGKERPVARVTVNTMLIVAIQTLASRPVG